MRYDRILTAVASQPWAIERATGERLAAILTSRLSGERPTPAALDEAREVKAARDAKKAKRKPAAVALIPLHGVMTHRADWFDQMSGVMGTVEIGRLVDEAAADPSVDAIVLDVDSPGGSVFGTAELADKVAAAAKQKKVIAVADAMAASAAYYVASQASELVVTPSGMVGSIGVYTMHVDRSGELAEAGIKVTLISSTPEKVAGHGYAPLDELGLSQQTDVVQGYYKQFVKAVADGRGRSQADVRENFGKGGVLLADEAVKRGLADKVASLDDVLGRYGLSAADLTAAAAATAPEPTAKGPDWGVELRRRKLRLAGGG